MMPNTSAWYFVFLGIVAFSRIAEVIYAKGLSKKAGARGDKPEKEKNFISMVALHTLFFCGITAEVLWQMKPVPSWLTISAGVLFLGALCLRIWTLKTLHTSWNVRIVKPAKIITHGPYQYLRHPNYLVVILEIAVIPLLGGAYLSAIVFSTWNAIVLYYRIPKEEAMLFQIPGYKEAFEHKSRLWPRRVKS